MRGRLRRRHFPPSLCTKFSKAPFRAFLPESGTFIQRELGRWRLSARHTDRYDSWLKWQECAHGRGTEMPVLKLWLWRRTLLALAQSSH